MATQEKLKAMADLVQENVTKAQKKQKRYDKRARLRQFDAGDPVLVLQPTATVVKRLGKVSYLVDMHDKRKRQRGFHVNMLKKFRVRKPIETSFLVESESAEDINDLDVLLWNDSPEGQATLGEQLDPMKREQLQQVLNEFADVVQNKPGRTAMMEHRIDTGTANPVRLPPYRLPHAYSETVQSELKEMLEDGIINIFQ